MSTELQTRTETLNVGVITMNRSWLLSPNREAPALLSEALQEGESIERRAHQLLIGAHGLAASSHYALRQAESGDKGYLLRECSPIIPDEYEMAAFSRGELFEYIASKERADSESHFLRQIALYME